MLQMKPSTVFFIPQAQVSDQPAYSACLQQKVISVKREYDSVLWKMLQGVAKVEQSRLLRQDRRKRNDQGYKEVGKARGSSRASPDTNASSCANCPVYSTCPYMRACKCCQVNDWGYSLTVAHRIQS
jgi:hypothetical protein